MFTPWVPYTCLALFSLKVSFLNDFLSICFFITTRKRHQVVRLIVLRAGAVEERELGKKGGRICKMKVEVEEEFRKEAFTSLQGWWYWREGKGEGR